MRAHSVFGHLENWDCVLERLEELTRSGQIDDCQEALVALLRYPDNWRLREAALEAAATVVRPTAALVRQLCRLTVDERLYFQARVLAAEALGAALARLQGSDEAEADELLREAREQMQALLRGHGVPVLHQAVRRSLPKAV